VTGIVNDILSLFLSSTPFTVSYGDIRCCNSSHLVTTFSTAPTSSKINYDLTTNKLSWATASESDVGNYTINITHSI
jgi:hypothetical protein